MIVKKDKKSNASDSESDSASGSDDSEDDSDSNNDSKGKKSPKDCNKKTKKSKTDCEKVKKSKVTKVTKKTKQSDSDNSGSDSESDEEDYDKKKKKSSVDKKKVAGVIFGGALGGALLKKLRHSQSSSSSSASEADSDDSSKKPTTVIDKKKLTTGQSTLDVTVIVREWYEKLILDVSQRSKKGGSNASADIEVIVQKSTATITETLRLISVNAHKSVTDTTTVQQYRASIEWTKNLVIQSSYQIKAIGINSAASSSSKTGGIEQMRPIAVAIQQQVDVEIRRYKLIVENTEVVQKKTETVVSAIEHKKHNESICTGRKAAVNRKEYCLQLEQHVSEVLAESKVVIISWFAQLVRDVSICVHQGGNVDENVSVIIEKSKLELESNIKRTQYKFSSSIDVYEKDKTFALIQTQINESLKVVQTTMTTKMVEIQQIITKHHSESEVTVVTEKLSAVLESSKVSITDTLETGCKKSITVIQQDTTQTESTVRIIDTVESVRTIVTHWHTKLIEEIHSISIEETITNKEERIELLIKQATDEVERATTEAKTKVSEDCSSVKKISKTKEQELISSIEYVQKTFATDVEKIQTVSIEAIKKSDTNIKETISTAVQSSREKIDSYLTRVTASVIGVATAAIAVHAIKKHEEQEKKTEVHNEWSIDVKDNVSVMSKWFELFTKRISDSVYHDEGDVVEKINSVAEHAEQEITQIITTARTDFIKRLSHENLDQESYNYACKHYEESLETVRVSIITQVAEAKKVAIHAHTTGNTQILETELTKITVISTETIKVAMGSSVVITHKAKPTTSTSTNAGSVLEIEVKDDNAIVLGEENVEFERKQQSAITHEVQKVEDKKIQKGINFYIDLNRTIFINIYCR